MHVRQMRTVLAIALAAGALVVLDSGRQVSAAPPPCIPFEGHCYAPCTDPSSLCPPNSSYAPEYTWQDGSTGGTFEEFTGGPGLPSDFASFTSSCPYDPTSSDAGDYQLCSVPSGNGPTNPPNSADAWFAGDSNHVAVAAGELHVTTSWTSSIQDCTDYWHYVVGDSVHGCWESGTVSQQDSVWSPPTGATEHFAFRAKWVQDSGTSIPDLDSTLQASSDFPPEIDVVESSEPSTSFTSFVHCLGESPGLQDQNATSLNLFAWHTYEFALTS
jgi:hypothetical protein